MYVVVKSFIKQTFLSLCNYNFMSLTELFKKAKPYAFRTFGNLESADISTRNINKHFMMTSIYFLIGI